MRRFLAVAALLLLLCTWSAFAQQKCQDFRALYHMTLCVNLDEKGTCTEQGWLMDTADPIHALLDLQPLTPTMEFTGAPPVSWSTGVVGHDRGNTTTWHLSDTDSFVVGDWHATYPNQPGKVGLWQYNGTGKIISGTGKFANATGMATETGPYIIWPDVFDADGPHVVAGKYFATIVMRICTP